jgi:hypothetical protein
MKIMRKILIGIVVLLSIIMLANIFLPGTVVVKRSRVMPISKGKVPTKTCCFTKLEKLDDLG